MTRERTQTGNVFRFRQVKWGNPRHALTALRNKKPVAADEPGATGMLFWVLVVMLTLTVFASIMIIGGQHPHG